MIVGEFQTIEMQLLAGEGGGRGDTDCRGQMQVERLRAAALRRNKHAVWRLGAGFFLTLS